MGVNVARLSEPPDTMLLYFELSYEAVMSSTNSQSGDGAPPRFTANTPISGVNVCVAGLTYLYLRLQLQVVYLM